MQVCRHNVFSWYWPLIKITSKAPDSDSLFAPQETILRCETRGQEFIEAFHRQAHHHSYHRSTEICLKPERRRRGVPVVMVVEGGQVPVDGLHRGVQPCDVGVLGSRSGNGCNERGGLFLQSKQVKIIWFMVVGKIYQIMFKKREKMFENCKNR